ncbi:MULTISPECIES: hypothetical protein [unclassified Methanosarcina]|uniref:DUF7544 domain-containing protein n=1 Tax=unclassified Methanosarcina TaxID=2644672 RepID=UPI000615829F|nr:MULTISPECIES: hypothetical protein [unclassified Methanosarcina]AKB18174.1 hypothetical protein MSWHS_1311 [Methanosarcina sp. WWM596]AKB21506.1 hypothetical protein MSWH1_1235 [Methanosarcina sp. WH1]
MSWYGIDAIDKAVSRTKTALFEPFDFWKWVKLAIIIFLLGNIGYNYGGSGTNYRMSSEDFGNNFPNIEPGRMPDFLSGVSWIGFDHIQSIAPLAIIATIIAFIFLLALIFSYISSVMEFVFVEALVKNEVHFWAYSKKFLGKGFNLLLIRLALGIVFLVLFGLSLLPFVPIILKESPDFSFPAIIGGVFWFFGVIIMLALLGAVVSSFLSLAIPLAIYRESGILSAFRTVYRNFRKSWKEVLVYWLIRFLLGIGIAIFAVILFGLLMLALGIVFLIIDVVLYFLFSTFVSESLVWILLIPFVIVELLLLFVTLMLLSVPLAVFLKYHLLSFLEAWFVDANIPFFDKLSGEPEIGFGTELSESVSSGSESGELEPGESKYGELEPNGSESEESEPVR